VNRPSFRALLFDLDDTLCDDLAAAEQTVREVAARAAEHLPGTSADALTDAYVRVSDVFWTAIDLIQPPPLNQVRARMWREAVGECGHPGCDPSVIDDLVALHVRLRHSRIALFPDALPTLDRLRADGYRLGLVTNGVSETHAEKIVGLGIRDHFDAVLMPDRVGFAKPDRRVFELACRMLGVSPAETAMVGDSAAADVAGARGAGLFAVWFNPAGAAFPAGLPQPDAEVRALADVPDVIAAAAAAAAAASP
jgi:putative hydrolase of the HAD superfamily